MTWADSIREVSPFLFPPMQNNWPANSPVSKYTTNQLYFIKLVL